jgi:hypothetical protein
MRAIILLEASGRDGEGISFAFALSVNPLNWLRYLYF